MHLSGEIQKVDIIINEIERYLIRYLSIYMSDGVNSLVSIYPIIHVNSKISLHAGMRWLGIGATVIRVSTYV